MPQVIRASAGTDIAEVVLFDPEALPAEFEERLRKSWSNPAELVEEVEADGGAAFIFTGADGGYLLHLFVDEDLDAERRRLVDLESVRLFKRFRVPSGVLFWMGAEYMFRESHSQFDVPSPLALGTKMSVQPGVYELRLYLCKTPEDEPEERLRDAVGPERARMVLGAPWGCMSIPFGALAAFILFKAGMANEALLCVLVMVVGGGIAAIRGMRSAEYLAVQSKWREIEMEYPSVVGVMRRTGDDEK